MDLSSLQNEINHLLYLYYNIIGLAQSSIDDAKQLTEELLLCKQRIEEMLDNYKNSKEEKNIQGKVEEAERYIEEGFAFLDMLMYDQ